MKRPVVYISWFEYNAKTGESVPHKVGPFLSVSPDGSGVVIGQDWTAYQVVMPNGAHKRIIIPKKCHSIRAGYE